MVHQQFIIETNTNMLIPKIFDKSNVKFTLYLHTITINYLLNLIRVRVIIFQNINFAIFLHKKNYKPNSTSNFQIIIYSLKH